MKWITVAAKELLLLFRDKAGLGVLFLMPVILVVVITLVQQNLMKVTGQNKTTLLVLDLDGDAFGQALQERIGAMNMAITLWNSGAKSHTQEELRAAIRAGEYQIGLVIPNGATGQMEREIFGAGSGAVAIPVLFDPTVTPTLRSTVSAQFAMAAELMTLQYKYALLRQRAGSFMGKKQGHGESVDLPLSDAAPSPLLSFSTDSQETLAPAYNPSQQNVSAWALFGMFFTAIPIAGSILQERNSGIMARLISSPVSQLSFHLGKIAAYLCICLCQFFLIYLIGRYIFPLVGLQEFTANGRLPEALLVVICSGLAACGLGLLLGNLCSSYEQASTLGATAVVTAAALGGIMVPVYAMPTAMQNVSRISPLNWGQSAFQELLVRGNGLAFVSCDLCLLIGFFLIASAAAWLVSTRRTYS